MAQILPREPSLSELIGSSVGQGIGQGVGQGMQSLNDMVMKQALQQHQMSQLGNILGVSGSQQGQQQPLQVQGEPQVGQQRDQVPTGNRIKEITDNPMAMAQIESVNKPFADMLFKMRTNIDASEKLTRKEEFQREQSGEKTIGEWQDTLDNLEMSGMRYDRLGELFKPENDEKYPNNVAVGLFSKDGKLNDLAYTALARNPEAQESIKLIYQDLQNAKNTYGAKLTNFDVATYLQQLPSLLNTPDGRRQILTDIRKMNDFNRKYYQETLDIINQKGGPSKTSLSQARNIWRKQNKDYVQDFKESFVHQRVRMVSPEGEEWMIPYEKVKEAQKAKWKKVGE
jgi:hypothetical protein